MKDKKMEKLTQTLNKITPSDLKTKEKALQRLAEQARPAGSLGILEGVGAKLAAIAEPLTSLSKKK